MDTMKITKIASGVLGAWLILLLGKWAGEFIYHSAGHGEASYVIEVAETSGGDAGEAVPFAEVLALADVGEGEKVFKKCGACHKLEQGVNAVGPYLYGVVGRDIASASGFAAYSPVLAGMEGDWTPEALSAFLEKPSGFAPGTTMGFAGLKKVEDRANVIAYLDSLDD